jgi:hypothetical protein
MSARDTAAIVRAAVMNTRPDSPYSELPWLADVRASAAVAGVSAAETDAALIELHQADSIELRRADMVQGVADKAAASELTFCGETWHYAGLAD